MDILLSVALIVAKSLLMIVVLLIYIAYALYADRKVWAAVQLRTRLVALSPAPGPSCAPAAVRPATAAGPSTSGTARGRPNACSNRSSR